MDKERLDIVVQQRFGITRSKAQGLIHTGNITDGDGIALTKPGMKVDGDVLLRLRSGPRFVSRGGDKLAHGLNILPMEVAGRTVIDVGASTGGFTDCLLQHGASRVYAVDVGYGQLAWPLRQDPRVIVLERCNIRTLKSETLSVRPDRFTVDCSFISLKLVLPALLPLLGPCPEGIVLIKPQFEAGRDRVSRGGVVRDAHVHETVIRETALAAMELGFQRMFVTASPLLGPAGNREFLAWLHKYDAEQGVSSEIRHPQSRQ